MSLLLHFIYLLKNSVYLVDRKWITKVIKDSYKPLTQYYFQKYSMTPDQIPVEFDRFLIRLDIEDKSEAEMFLIIVSNKAVFYTYIVYI